MKSIRN